MFLTPKQKAEASGEGRHDDSVLDEKTGLARNGHLAFDRDDLTQPADTDERPPL